MPRHEWSSTTLLREKTPQKVAIITEFPVLRGFSSENPTKNPLWTHQKPASRSFGDFYAGTLRDSLRKLSGRSRSPSHKQSNNIIRVNIPAEVADRPAAYSMRTARVKQFQGKQ